MKYPEIYVIVNLIKFAIALYPRANDNLIRVQSPEEANGKPYFLDFIGLAKKFGYDTEQHFVTTEDGYNIEIFRIVGSSLSPKIRKKPVALLQHGLDASSEEWIFYNRSLAFFLADTGYDVWVGNCRGNTYGRSHNVLSSEDPLFWNFTFHEIGIIDYPATIDYILNETNKSSLTVIGHSMGATCIAILLSEKPEYNERVNIAVLMTPIVYWKNVDLIRLTIWSLAYVYTEIFDSTGMSELFSHTVLFYKISSEICKTHGIVELCIAAFGLIVGYDRAQLHEDDFITLLNYYPCGVSTKTFRHYCQYALNSGKFQKYDYGAENPYYYGQLNPPDYKVSNIVTNMAIFYGSNDPFCNKESVAELSRQVSTNIIIENIKYQKFSHMDFAMAINIKTMFHDKLLEVISKYKD